MGVFCLLAEVRILIMGYWHQTAYERYGKPPHGNQELLVVRDKVGRPRVSLG